MFIQMHQPLEVVLTNNLKNGLLLYLKNLKLE